MSHSILGIPLKLCLVLSNFSLVGYLLVLITKHFSHHYDLKSFSSIFHFLCFCWLFIRGVFWISTMTNYDWSQSVTYLLYWTPLPLEFGAFFLLPLYYAQILYPEEWKNYWSSIQWVYIISIATLLATQVIYLLMAFFRKVRSPYPFLCNVGLQMRNSISTIQICIFRICSLATVQKSIKTNPVSRWRFQASRVVRLLLSVSFSSGRFNIILPERYNNNMFCNEDHSYLLCSLI
jgi:hypothetical protein